MIEALCQGQDTVATDPAIGRFKPHNAIRHRRVSDRAAGVGTQAGETEPGRRGYARAAGGYTRPEFISPGVTGNIEIRIVSGQGALGEIQLA